MAPTDYNNFPEFQVTFPHEYVAHVEINRPKKLNSFAPEYVLPHGACNAQTRTSPSNMTR